MQEVASKRRGRGGACCIPEKFEKDHGVKLAVFYPGMGRLGSVQEPHIVACVCAHVDVCYGGGYVFPMLLDGHGGMGALSPSVKQCIQDGAQV